MHTPHEQSATAHSPLAARWRRARAAYRLANRASHHVLGFTLRLALLGYFAFAILFLMLRYAILPNIDYYKGDIERMASRALGNQVSIARIYASWHGLHPSLFLGDVILRDKQGRQVLSLPSVGASVSWWSMLAGQPRFASLEIIRPELDIRRDAAGLVYVAGIALGAGADDGEGADWAFKQDEIVIREGRLHWTDQLRGAPELALENVNMVLLNNWNHHRFALKATPPPGLAQPIDIRADFTHPRFAARISDMAAWKGELYADVQGTDLAAWKPYLDYPFQLAQGKGSVRAWLTLDHAKLAGFTADVALAGVDAQLGPGLPRLDLARVSGRMSAREEFLAGSAAGKPAFGADGHSMTLSDFSVETRDGLVLAPTTLSETFTPARGGKPEKMELRARQLDLETLAALAAQLPLSAPQRQMLADFGPRGRLLDFSAQWQGRYPAISAYRVQGKVAGLGLKAQPARLARPKTALAPAQAAMPAIPGFENLSGAIDATDAGGSVSLDSQQLVLQLPSWFADPAMPFDRLALRAHWSFEPKDQLLVRVESMNFVQGRLSGTVSGKHLMPLKAQGGKALGNVDVNLSLSGLELNRIGKYLPLQTPPELRAWLSGALEGGVAEDVSVKLRGELAQFPFRPSAGQRPKGEFRVAGRIVDGKLNYAPAHLAGDGKSPLWPQAENINGTIAFDGARMEIRADNARTAGMALHKVKAVVPDLLAPDRLLDIDGSASGALQGFLNYVAASPVLGWIGHFTEDARASGNARLALKLHLPLARLGQSSVLGSLQLMNNDVLLLRDLPALQSAIGKLEFNERGVTLNGIGASFLGGPLALTGGSGRDDAILIKMGGTVSADGLRRAFPGPAMQNVAGRIGGSTRFTGAVQLKDHQLQVTLDSQLTGLGLDFPAPLKKAAADALPLHFALNGTLPGEGGVGKDDIKISLGTAVAARYQRQKQGRGAWTVQRGGIGVNLPAPEPDSGMMMNVSLKSLNVDQWSAIGSAIGAAKPAGTRAQAEPDGISLGQYIVPDMMAARADELIVGERKLDNVVVGATHQKNSWQASIDSRQVSGHVSWEESGTGQGLGKVTARLASLIIPESAEAQVKDLLESGTSTATIPALDIVAERFELFNKQLGRLELAASNEPALAGREWRINKLSLSNPDGELKSTGKWITKEGRSSTSLTFVLAIDDAGKLLDRFGFPDTLRRGKGKLSGDIAWNGLPYSLDIPSLSGQIELDVESGQFLKQDPGAAKLLGVLSLQALPRLLKLDFHDVFSQGLAFDGISANAVITKGVLKTDNLKMHGVSATVLMDGTADIANESTNLHVVVIPEFNLGTGPLVYALAVNPVIGLGGFLAQLFLRAPMMKALTYQMKVSGPWKAPLITKLDNARNDPAPAQPN